MITAEKSRESTALILEFVNIFRKEPITLQGFKNQRAKEAKSNKVSYDSITGGLVPYGTVKEQEYKGTISLAKVKKIIDGEV